MDGKMIIETSQVREIANAMENTNNELKATLESAQKRITSLESVWSGDASQASINAINSFAQEYFQSYYNLIDEYVKFLRTNVADAYDDTEASNTSLADSFE